MSKFTFKLNKTISQGDTRIIKLVFDTTIFDWDFFYTAKRNFTDTDDQAAIAYNPSDMTLLESATDYTNILIITLDTLDTNIEPGRYIHDIKVVKPGGVPNTIAKGYLVVEGHSTKRKTE